MEINKDAIKKALDDFENDQYVDSKEKLADEVRKKVNDYLKNKTGVEKDPINVQDDEEEDDNDYQDDE